MEEVEDVNPFNESYFQNLITLSTFLTWKSKDFNQNLSLSCLELMIDNDNLTNCHLNISETFTIQNFLLKDYKLTGIKIFIELQKKQDGFVENNFEKEENFLIELYLMNKLVKSEKMYIVRTKSMNKLLLFNGSSLIVDEIRITPLSKFIVKINEIQAYGSLNKSYSIQIPTSAYSSDYKTKPNVYLYFSKSPFNLTNCIEVLLIASSSRYYSWIVFSYSTVYHFRSILIYSNRDFSNVDISGIGN